MKVNEALVRARLALASPTRPLHPMSRRELAELVRTYIWDAHRRRIALDENYIGKLERNDVRWPGDIYREALRAVLGAATDADLGFHPPGGRRAAAGPSGPSARTPTALVSATLVDVLGPAPVPRRVGPPEIDQIWGAAHAFHRWDNLYGGAARDGPVAQLRWAVGLLRAGSCPPELRPELLSAIAYLAHTCGFMAFDGLAFDDARRLLGFGVACAEEADDWHLRARLLGTSARLETWVGQLDRGLTHAHLALVRSDRLTATERAMLHSLEARALARMQHTQDALAAVGRADDEFAGRDPAEDPPWMVYYDVAQHAGDVGAALLDLTLAGSGASAVARARYATAIDRRRPELARSLALSRVGLAKVIMVTGDPAEAAQAGHAALDAATSIRSGRLADDLAHLGRLAEPHQDRADVDELRERILAAATA
ncbi:MAG TPA: hypothetical protein VFM27_12325 [Acidimicrobiales bacterium]|nr:hypothetical protein [Acidimicrobiales bacterium]